MNEELGLSCALCIDNECDELSCECDCHLPMDDE